jgi:hypothetical protein
VGLFVEWVMVRAEPEEVEELFRAGGARSRGACEGWALARTQDADPVELSQSLTEKTAAPALGGWVYDSDFAFLVGIGPDGRAFELLVGEPYETDEDYLERLAAPEGRRKAAQALSTWSKTNAPRSVQPEAVLTILEAECVFAEEGIYNLFAELGLPDASGIFEQL